MWERSPAFNSTQRLYDAVHRALRLEFAVDQGLAFNPQLQARARAQGVRPLFAAQVRTQWSRPVVTPSRHTQSSSLALHLPGHAVQFYF